LDNIGLVKLFQELFSFMLNAVMPELIVHHDNTLLITLVTKGGAFV
jgi:hypothetical protein